MSRPGEDSDEESDDDDHSQPGEASPTLLPTPTTGENDESQPNSTGKCATFDICNNSSRLVLKRESLWLGDHHVRARWPQAAVLIRNLNSSVDVVMII